MGKIKKKKVILGDVTYENGEEKDLKNYAEKSKPYSFPNAPDEKKSWKAPRFFKPLVTASGKTRHCIKSFFFF